MMTEYEWRNKERLTGALEMAGGICHELNQPLQAAEGFSELLLMKISEDNPLFDTVTKIRQQVERMGEITKKLMWIDRYKTKRYLQQKIFDIDEAAMTDDEEISNIFLIGRKNN